MHSFGQADKTRLHKFNHGWLPTGKRMLLRKDWNHSKCLRCACKTKDEMHLLCCPADEANDIRKDWLESLSLWLMEEQTDPQLRRLLLRVCTGLTTDGHFLWEYDEEIPMSLAQAIDDQQLIGWQQFFSGRFATRFKMHQQQFLDRNYPKE